MISTKSSSLLRQRCADVFEALKMARGLNNSETHEARLAQILVDIEEGQQAESQQEEDSEEELGDNERDSDLMTSDDEDDGEEIEPENEDHAFLVDETRTGRYIILQKIEHRVKPEQKERTEAETTKNCRL